MKKEITRIYNKYKDVPPKVFNIEESQELLTLLIQDIQRLGKKGCDPEQCFRLWDLASDIANNIEFARKAKLNR